MHGMVWQWCQDVYGDYPKNDVVDPQGSNVGGLRVLRGGSWQFRPEYCRSAIRNKHVPGIRSTKFNFGLRICFFVE